MRVSERLAAARAADELEFEQTKLRLIIVACMEVYFLVTFLWDRVLDDGELFLIGLVFAIFLFGVAHLGWMLARPGPHHPRRRSGVLLDISALTLGMVLGGEAGAVLYGLYLWVVVGNGFRFGRWYLHYAQVLSICGFSVVMALSEFWRQHTTLGIALGLTLLAIPFYVSLLIARLHAASRRLQEARGDAEAANIAKTKFLAAASHDLRQPMQALSMYASVLEERVADADTLRVVHGIRLSVTNLEQMFDSLLDISKLESGVVRPSVVAFPLAPLLRQVAEA